MEQSGSRLSQIILLTAFRKLFVCAVVYHNNFNNNYIQAIDTNSTTDSFGSSTNSWDNGYPSGGNFWSNYTGGDNCSGPNQDMCPSPDGIGDTPYVFSYNQDNYPLMTSYLG